MTATISWRLICGIVKSDRGWKHITLQVPFAGSNLNSSESTTSSVEEVAETEEVSGTFGNMAGKSLSKTNVDSYSGFLSPFGLTTPGQSGFDGSKGGTSSSWAASTWPLHGLFRR